MRILERTISGLSKLPGIGRKSASRIAYFLLKADLTYVEELVGSIQRLRQQLRNCGTCGNYAEEDPCEICSDLSRDRSSICVVEEPKDVHTLESTREYLGLYHVLMGVISPIDGVGPQNLRIRQLLERVRSESVREVIVATNPTLEGETTALYIAKILKDTGVPVSRLASGLPFGGDLEYADRLTLVHALKGRNPLPD